jgi:hypothetical protein
MKTKPTSTMMMTILLLAVMTDTRHTVSADRMIRFTFNDGMAPTLSNECTVSDNRFIDPLFNVTANLRTRRQLIEEKSSRSVPDDAMDPYEQAEMLYQQQKQFEPHRELFAASCRDNCAGYARGTCRATGCVGYRRRRDLKNEDAVASTSTQKDNSIMSMVSDDPNYHQRETFTTCDVQVALIHKALDLLISSQKVSAPCQLFLAKSKRKSECYDDVIYGEILSFTFWNMNLYNSRRRPVMGVLQSQVPNGATVCNNIAFNVEAVLNPCVSTVTFTMTGPNNSVYTRIDSGHPMLLFDTAANAATFGGRYLTPGAYSITARPDSFAYKEKKINFTVIAC